MPIDIIVNDTMFYISQPTNSNPNQWPGGHIAVTDIDYNSYYKTFSSASPFRLFENYDAVNQPIFKSIWDYKLVDTSGNPSYSYGNGLGTAQWSEITGAYTTNANNNPIIIENQVSVYNPSSGNTVSIIPKIYFMTSSVGFAHGAVYTGADGKYRYVICMGAYSFSVLIS
jgi:hypothetical protein